MTKSYIFGFYFLLFDFIKINQNKTKQYVILIVGTSKVASIFVSLTMYPQRMNTDNKSLSP